MVNAHGSIDLFEYLRTALFIFCVALIPTLVIHFNYYFKNRNDSLEIDGGLVVLSNGNDHRTISIDEITAIRCYMTTNFAEKNTPWLPWEEYHFFVIVTDAEYYVITSLMFPRLHEKIAIEEDKIVIIKDWFPITSIYNAHEGSK